MMKYSLTRKSCRGFVAVRGAGLPSWRNCGEITNETDSRRPLAASLLRNRENAGKDEAKNLGYDCVTIVAFLRVHEYLIS